MGKNPLKEKYCKFCLFTDKTIGLASIDDVANSQSVIETKEDEDYSTDAEVMRNTKRLCERDLRDSYRTLVSDQAAVERGCHNYKYQVWFAGQKKKVAEEARVL